MQYKNYTYYGFKKFKIKKQKICGTYKIATNCFTISELQKFQYFLLTKFNLKTTLHKDNGIYIRKESANTFKELVFPYIIDSMKYKLYQNCHLTP